MGLLLVAIVAVCAAVRSAYRHRRGLAELTALVLTWRAWRRP